MAVIAGPIEKISFAGRGFAVAEDSDPTRDLGGFVNSKEMNGDGTSRTIKKRKPWLIEGISIQIDDDREDQKFLQDQIDDGGDKDVQLIHASGEVFYGQGTLVDDLKTSSLKAVADVNFGGGGKLIKQ